MKERALKLKRFQDKLEEFLVFLDVEKNVSKHTLRAYESDLTQLVDFWQHIGSKEGLDNLTFEKIIRRYNVSLFYKKISKTSLARKLSSLRSFLSFLKAQGISQKISIKSPRLDKKLPSILTVDEVFYLLDSIRKDDLPSKYPHRDKALFELLYATGIRCSELVQISLHDINFEDMSILIRGKGKRERIVLFGSKAQQALEEYLFKERPTMLKGKDPECLFLNCNGTQITTRSVQRVFEMFRKFLKIDRKLTPHKVRHSFATHLLNKGVNLRVIQELLGHKTINSTQIYTHVSNKHLAKMCDEKHPLNKLDDLVLEDDS